MKMQKFDVVTYQPIDIPSIFTNLHSPNTGGIVLFSGEVRYSNMGRTVQYLEYEAYEPMAKLKIYEILNFAINNWQLNEAICIHRLGKLVISECAVLIITTSCHRAQAYEANRFIIDKVKIEVPIWKKEYFTDGTSDWGKNR